MRLQFLPVVSDHNKYSQIRTIPNELVVLKQECNATIAVRYFDNRKRYEVYSDGILIWYGDKVSKRILYDFRLAKELAAGTIPFDQNLI